MPLPAFFVIHATDVPHTRDFYSDLLAWTVQPFPGLMEYSLVSTGPDSEPGMNGGLLKIMGGAPATEAVVNSYVCRVGGVANVDEPVQNDLSLGGELVLPKMPIRGIGWLA